MSVSFNILANVNSFLFHGSDNAHNRLCGTEITVLERGHVYNTLGDTRQCTFLKRIQIPFVLYLKLFKIKCYIHILKIYIVSALKRNENSLKIKTVSGIRGR